MKKRFSWIFVLLAVMLLCGTSWAKLADDMMITGNFPKGYTVNNWYSASVAASGGVTNYTYNITSGSLPPGFYIRHDGGRFYVEGIPNKAGTYTFKLRVTDQRNTYTEREFTLNIKSEHYSASDMSLTGKFPEAYTVNNWYSASVQANGGVTNYTFNITSGNLPTWFYIRQDGKNFYLEGIPAHPGTYTFTLRVTDRRNSYTERSFTMTINGSENEYPDPIAITTLSLPYAGTGSKYDETIQATGTVTSWKITQCSSCEKIYFRSYGIKYIWSFCVKEFRFTCV
ncbi:MAG: hypothetical protein IJU48_08920 [Synergistaceae bacterium]|nr:hypothetical protein [Synergistaceae bacterium]